MKKVIIPINKGQRLSDIYTIETNTILCKTHLQDWELLIQKSKLNAILLL